MKPICDQFELEFCRIHKNSLDILDSNTFEALFRGPSESEVPPGMLLVRSAAKVEQCCGGISSRLWDDPFEWTLPESFAGKKEVLRYFSEVEEARKRAFSSFESDSDLLREIPAPVDMTMLFTVLLRAHADASAFLERARQYMQKPVSPG